VLVATRHPGNIGSAARAMKVMGLTQLGLVAPEEFPSPAATALAAGAEDVLTAAAVYPDVRAAVSDCGLVVGTTARPRELNWHIAEPREAGAQIVESSRASNVAILFGPERAGLANDDLEQCQRLITIPSAPDYASLNVAMAVQIVAYELWLAARSAPLSSAPAVPLASAYEMEQFYRHLDEVLDAVGFHDRTGEGHLQTRLRRLFNRSVLDQNEVNILRGILTAVQGRRRRAGDPHLHRDGAP
jgi:TrmH family RNA methyltransferase